MSTPPDPSLPNQQDARVREIVQQVLSDTTALPDPFLAWLQDYVNLSYTPAAASTTATADQGNLPG